MIGCGSEICFFKFEISNLSNEHRRSRCGPTAKEGRIMDFLKSQFGRVQQQFGQLNASQKMLSVALMTIMVMTLVWWGRYAGTAEMEPLIDQDFAAEDMGRITAGLRARGIPYQ